MSSAPTATQLEQRLRELCEGTAASFGVQINIEYRRGYPPTINTAAEALICAETAAGLVGADCVDTKARPSMGAEDFAYFLHRKPGAYVWIGNGPGEGGCMLHNPTYDFNDEVIPAGVAYWCTLVQRLLGGVK